MNFWKQYKAFATIMLVISLVMPQMSFALPKKGQPAPPFQVVATSGQKISLANYRGYVLVIEFFATWCGGCKDSIPHLMNLQKQYGKQGLRILGLDIGQGDDLNDLKDFVAKKKISYPMAMADEDLVYDGFGIHMIPALFIINKKGVLVEKLNGFNDDNRKILEATVKKLVAE
jgi:peroxiredoxin